eukprot:Awhi_evm2s14340
MVELTQGNSDEEIDLVMISRLAAILRGLSLTLGQNVSVAEQWLPFAQEYLEKSSAYKRKHEL